ncbi:unnamed protein product [Miscanthus lutarioriparius]|uniref:Uncharacterized protein n=1 Tax=Miscanthus lutarioriparius TaxID=422564 RepID=A0A811PJ99_9POAL|nr:unnamed protein product [Miscanthus lutarioriparius]
MASVAPKGAPSTQRLRREQTQPVAFELDVPPEDIIADLIIANHLLFAISGEYTGFLATEATSNSGGKVVMISS